MEIKVYNFTKRKNSTKKPLDTEGTTLNVKLKENTSIYNPSFRLHYTSVPTFNYLKWGSRYYYINDISLETNEVYLIDCAIDSLATYKSDIKNTSAFVKYSTNVYDTQIIDNRLSMSGDVEVTRKGAKLYTHDISYNVLFVSSQPNYGGIGLLSGDMYFAQQISSLCTSQAFLDQVMGGAIRQIQGAYDCLLQCIRMPFNTRTHEYSGSMYLASWEWQGNFNMPSQEGYHFGVDVDIPWQYNDFRRTSKYCSVFLWLPFVGFVQINTDDIRTQSKLRVIMNVNGINGIGSIEVVEAHAHYPCNVGADIPIGTIKGNLPGTIASSIGLVGSIATGNVLGIASNTFNAIESSMEHKIGATSGSTGGYNDWALPFASADPTYVYCYVLQHDTSDEPNSMAERYGRPLNNVIELSEVNGYAECENASVNTNAPSEIKDEINNYLNGGVYIE